jgi:hypothetical protein
MFNQLLPGGVGWSKRSNSSRNIYGGHGNAQCATRVMPNPGETGCGNHPVNLPSLSIVVSITLDPFDPTRLSTRRDLERAPFMVRMMVPCFPMNSS